MRWGIAVSRGVRRGSVHPAEDRTPREVSTLFGEVRLERVGYRDATKSAERTVFPSELALRVAGGATPALSECTARYQAEAGVTQRRTLARLKAEQGWPGG